MRKLLLDANYTVVNALIRTNNPTEADKLALHLLKLNAPFDGTIPMIKNAIMCELNATSKNFDNENTKMGF